MNPDSLQYFRCPYCGKPGGHEKKVGKTVGLFRVKIMYGTLLILECQKCKKVCRRLSMGETLTWDDMTSKEKEEWKKSAKSLK